MIMQHQFITYEKPVNYVIRKELTEENEVATLFLEKKFEGMALLSQFFKLQFAENCRSYWKGISPSSINETKRRADAARWEYWLYNPIFHYYDLDNGAFFMVPSEILDLRKVRIGKKIYTPCDAGLVKTLYTLLYLFEISATYQTLCQTLARNLDLLIDYTLHHAESDKILTAGLSPKWYVIKQILNGEFEGFLKAYLLKKNSF